MPRILRHLRANAVAYLALTVALGGTSYAAVQLERNSVGAKQIRAKAVRSAEIKDGAVKARDIAASVRSTLGATGPRGPQGEPGPATGAAGGDLEGSFPAPTLRAGALAAPDVLLVSAPGAPDFETLCGGSPWQPHDDEFYPVTIGRDRSGIVRLTGKISGGASSGNNVCGQVFVLPAGYRPAGIQAFAVAKETDPSGIPFTVPGGTISVEPNGRVAVRGGLSGDDAVFLDGIAFRCAPAGDGCP